MNREEIIMGRVQEHYDYIQSKGYEIIFLALQGSQNYGLDVYDEQYMSDVDTKAVILPSFEDFVYNRQPVSETIVLENNEHIDVKDVRVMFDTYKKQNVNFIETLFTKFRIVNKKYSDLAQILFDNAEEIAHININQAIRCMAGMSKEKLKALKHPYPTIVDKIEKYGYDPKQLHHILRMNDFIKKYAILKLPYKECLIPNDKEYLIKIKKGYLPEMEANKLAIEIDGETYNIKETTVTKTDIVNKKGINILDKIKFDLLERKFKEDLTKEERQNLKRLEKFLKKFGTVYFHTFKKEEVKIAKIKNNFLLKKVKDSTKISVKINFKTD